MSRGGIASSASGLGRCLGSSSFLPGLQRLSRVRDWRTKLQAQHIQVQNRSAWPVKSYSTGLVKLTQRFEVRLPTELVTRRNKSTYSFQILPYAKHGQLGQPQVRSLSVINRVCLAAESAATAFLNPERDDAVAILGELTGETALRSIHKEMLADANGRQILQEKWEIREADIDPQKLKLLPYGSFGKCYANFMIHHGFSPDKRQPVRHIGDPELAYVMQRYRQVHDFWHVLCGVQPTVLGEIAIKWFEMVQTGLPIATLSAFVGPLRLPRDEFSLLWSSYIPWATRSAQKSVFLMNVPYESYLEKDISAVRDLLKIEPFDSNAYLTTGEFQDKSVLETRSS